MGGGEQFSNPKIWSQSFSELMPLDSELVECCSVPLPSLTLRWYRMARGDSSWLFPFFQVSNALLTPKSQSIPPPPLFPLDNYKSVLCVCESVAVL